MMWAPTEDDVTTILDRSWSCYLYVRDGKSWEMPAHLRISVGLPDENRVFLEKLRGALSAWRG
jgi:histidinol-phosphate/aromatic aminotransferase/cobyric acid decarboxylase-like protein